MLVSRCVLVNHRVAALGLDATDGPEDRADVVDCEVTGNEVADRDPATGLWPSDHAGVVLRLRGL